MVQDPNLNLTNIEQGLSHANEQLSLNTKTLSDIQEQLALVIQLLNASNCKEEPETAGVF